MRVPSPLWPWLAGLLAALVYLPALPASFQFDDWQVVLGDPRVASLQAWWDSMPGMRALVKLSYALNHEWDAAAPAFRAVNIGLHALNTALVFMLVEALALRLHSTADAYGARVVAISCALVFALHPVQTESVTYVAARPNPLTTLFCLLALLAWLRGRVGRPALWWPLSALCFFAALACKETAAVLPLAMLLCACAEGRCGRRESAFPLCLCVLGGLLLALAWQHLPYDYLLRTSLDTRGPIENLAAQARGVTWLMGQLLRWDRLNADPWLQPETRFTAAVMLQAAAIGAVVVAGLATLRRMPALGFGVLWFFLWLAPTNSLLARLDVVNDRQLYFALIGPAWCLGHVIARWRAGSGALVLLLAITVACGTLWRNRVYATEIAFWQDVVGKSPANPRGWNNLGIANAVACRQQAARAAFEEAIRLQPDNPLPQVNRELLQRGELPAAQHCR